jgi:hypothetical protein
LKHATKLIQKRSTQAEITHMETEILENKLNEIRDTLIELERLKTDIRFISNKETEYFSEIVEKSAFFYRIYRNSIKLFVIDICKLLNPNEDFSLLKTLNYIQSNRKRIEWKRELKADRINELILEIENLNSEHLESFKNLRDKHYAHNDKKKFDLEYNVTLKKCWETLLIVQEIFIELSLSLLNEQYIFSILTKEPYEIISLLKYKRINEMVLTELKKGADIGNLQKVRDITLGKKPA